MSSSQKAASAGQTWEQRWHPLREEWVIIAAHRNERPWTGEYPWNATKENLYEYACHEGNYSLGGMLRGARQKEADDAKKGK